MPSFVLATSVRSREYLLNDNVEIYTTVWTLSRDLECYNQTSGRIVGQFKPGCITIKPRQACASVCQTQSSTTTGFESSIDLNTGPVVFYFDSNHAVSRHRGNFDA